MSSTTGALVAGVVAGYGIAMPMGAISVLIVQEGLTRGWRWACAAATGTGLVDLGYVSVALVAGAAVTDRLHGYTRTIQLVGAAVLVAVVVRGLLALRRTALPVGGFRAQPASRGGGPAAPAAASSVAVADPVLADPVLADPVLADPVLTTAGPLRTLRRFVALTAINPLTAVYFVVLTAGLGPDGDQPRRVPGRPRLRRPPGSQRLRRYMITNNCMITRRRRRLPRHGPQRDGGAGARRSGRRRRPPR